MLVDEADSILIDEARTPLIISALPGEDEQIAAEAYRWAAEVAPQFVEDEHYEYDHDDKTVELTLAGRQLRPRAAEAGGDGPHAAVDDLRVHRAGDQGGARDVPRPALRRPRRRDRDRRRVHRPPRRRPQVAGRHPPGGRSQGRRRDHLRHEPGGADHRAGLLPALQAPGRHDGHRQSPAPASCARSTQCRVDARAHEPPADPRAAARRSCSAPPTTSGRRSSKTSSSSISAGRPVLIGTRSIDKSELLSRSARRARHRARRCSTPGTSPRKRRSSPHAGAAGQGHRRHEHGRPRHRHPARPGRRRTRRPARHLHRAARIAAHRPPAHRPLRPAGRPRHVSPIPRARRRNPARRLRPEEGREAQSSRASSSPAAARSPASSRSSTRPSAKSSAATSATARCCSTTKRSARRCSGRWARIRIWIRRVRQAESPSCSAASKRPRY